MNIHNDALTFQSLATKRTTFVLATKNRSRFLSRALTRAKELRQSDDELIVIDGGSRDDTLQVLRASSDFIDAIVSEPDFSEAHAINKGLLLARGLYIKLLTDDDVIYATGMKAALELMDNNPSVDIMICGGTKIVGGKPVTAYVPPGSGYGSSVESVFKYGACGIGLVLRRSALARTGLMNPNAVSVDQDYVVRAIASGAKVVFARIHLYEHPILPHSGAVARRAELERDLARIRAEFGTPVPRHVATLRALRRWVGSIPYLGPPLTRVWRRSGRNRPQRLGTPPPPVWDGGFS